MRITVAGDGPERAAVEDAVRGLPNLRYPGRLDREAIDGLIGGALAVVVPSLWEEPGALVTLEAMARGTPLLVYRVGGIAEYVETAGAGVVVEQHPDALAAASRSLVDDQATWSRLSAAGTAAAGGRHSLGTHCAALERVFADAAAEVA
jgi:glycosyltransferase involved in cell wall biosynthesis